MKNLLNSDRYLDDAIFRRFMQEKLDALNSEHQIAVDLVTIYNKKHNIVIEVQFKETPYLMLLKKGMLTVEKIVVEAELLLKSESKLSVPERRFLGSLISDSMQKAINFYEKKKWWYGKWNMAMW